MTAQAHAEIVMRDGYVALIDADMADLLSQWNWRPLVNKDGYVYALASGRRALGELRTLYMHRLVMAAPRGVLVDHRFGDGLDNRRANLRLCTTSQNGANSRHNLNAMTPYKGVTLKMGRYWSAQITARGQRSHIGNFPTAEAAARAYDRAAIKHFGEFARLNFPAEWARAA